MGLFDRAKKQPQVSENSTPLNLPGVAEIGFVEGGARAILDPVNDRIIALAPANILTALPTRIYEFNNMSTFSTLPVSLTVLNYMALNHTGNYLAVTKQESGLPGKASHNINGSIVDLEKKMAHPFKAEPTYANGVHGSKKAAFSPHSALLALSDINGAVTIIDVESLAGTGRFNMPMKLTISDYFTSQAISWSPDGKMIAHFGDLCGFNTRVAYLWRVNSGEALNVSTEHAASLTFKAKGSASILNEKEVGMAFSRDSSLLAIGGDKKSDTLKLVDAINLRIVYETQRLGTSITTLVFSPDMGYLVSGSIDGVLRKWAVVKANNGFSLSLVGTKQFPGEIMNICYSQKNSDYLVAYKFDKKIGICRLKL